LRESGDLSGQTKGDEMLVIEYDDGTTDFATPLSAYQNTDMVSGPDEARRNNLDAPKVIEELGGSACETAISEDGSGQEHIVKEGIRKSDGWSIDDPEVHESAVKTLAATHYVGNGDVTPDNFRISDSGEFTIIDHDVAGAEFSPVQRSTRYNDVNQTAVKERIYEIACEFKQGDRSMPDGISAEMQQQISDTIDRSFEEAQRDPSYDVGAAGQNTNSLPLSDLSELSTGDKIKAYHSWHERRGRLGPDLIANTGSDKLRGNTTTFEVLSVEESSEGTTVKTVAVEDKQSDAAANSRTYHIKDNAQVREVR